MWACNQREISRAPGRCCIALVAIGLGPRAGRLPRRAALTLQDVNAAELAKPTAKASQAVNIKAQVLLDRAGFSPGAIDGRHGDNFANALRAFQKKNGAERERRAR